MHTREIVSYGTSVVNFTDEVNAVFQPEAQNEPCADNLHEGLLDQAGTKKLLAAQRAGFIKTGIFPDNSELLSVLNYADKSISCPDNWEGVPVQDRVDKGYWHTTTPAQRHSQAIDDAIQWLLKDRTTEPERIHVNKVFEVPGGSKFEADFAYELADGTWKVYKVEQAGHDSEGHLHRDACPGNTTKYWRQVFDWIGKKDCPIILMQIIDVDLREPQPSVVIRLHRTAPERCP